MSSGTDGKISISLSSIEKNHVYTQTLPNGVDASEIVLCGDTIRGQVRLSLSKNMRHRGITVKIVQRCISDTGILAEQVMSAVQLEKGGKVDRDFCAEFSFPTAQMKTLTYIGTLSMTYFIVATVNRLILSDLTTERRFVFLRPRAPPTPNEQFRLRVQRDGEADVSITTEKTSFATDDVIRGHVSVTNSASVMKVVLVLTSIETYRYGGPKVIEHVQFEYELVDGAPVNVLSAPFMVQLGPLRLWPSGLLESIMFVEYRLSLVVQLKDGENVTSSGRIELFNRVLS